MDTLLQMRTAVQDDLTVDSGSSFITPTKIDSAINRARRKAYGLFRWPELEDAKKTSTINGRDYYDYPETWQPDSIWKIEIDGVRYGEKPDGSPLVFSDFLNWKEDNPNSTEKKWSSQWRRFFVSPTPSTNGNYNISVWGQEAGENLVNDGDITIFSYSMPECNEAIVLEAVAILRAKGEEENSALFKSTEAKAILAVAWGKIRQNQQKYEKVQPFFEVPDMFGSRKVRTRNNTGNFNN